MHFSLLDRTLALSPTRVLTLKHVSSAEEYLGDHFPSFPVLPGVMTLECMVQAARLWARTHAGPLSTQRVVLGEVRALKYCALVRPGSTLRIEVAPTLAPDARTIDCKARALLVEPADASWALSDSATDDQLATLPVAASGRFTMRAVRAEPTAP